jgi:hypothetical protein
MFHKNFLKSLIISKIILSISILSSIPNIFGQTFNTGDFGNQEGIQVYYSSTSDHYYFGSYTGSAKSLEGKLYLILKDDRATINSTGIWVGIGFGSSSMIKSDMVMCFYIPQKEFYCEDYYSDANNIPKKDITLGGKNHILNSSGEIIDISVDGYKTMISFSFTKDISSPDSYDWDGFSSWQSNQSKHAGAWGRMSGRIPNKHTFRTSSSSLIDGEGYKNSLKLNLNQTPETPKNPTTPTPANTNTTTTSTIPTPTPATINPTNSDRISSKGILISILLMIFIL